MTSLACVEEFRQKKDVAGKELEQALWLATMELQRLEAWIPAKQDLEADRDVSVHL
jgi:hypothetical protein